jgi:hypothetical protein
MQDYEFLGWIHDRLVSVHGDNPGADFMLKLRSIADAMSAERVIPTITEDMVRAWMLRRLRQLDEEYGFRISSLTLRADRPSGSDLPEDDYFGVTVQALGACASLPETGTIDRAMARLVQTLMINPDAWAASKLKEATELLNEVAALQRLAEQPITKGVTHAAQS